jgi:hypothetical protein
MPQKRSRLMARCVPQIHCNPVMASSSQLTSVWHWCEEGSLLGDGVLFLPSAAVGFVILPFGSRKWSHVLTYLLGGQCCNSHLPAMSLSDEMCYSQWSPWASPCLNSVQEIFVKENGAANKKRQLYSRFLCTSIILAICKDILLLSYFIVDCFLL